MSDEHLAATRPPEGDALQCDIDDYGDDHDPLVAEDEFEKLIDSRPEWWPDPETPQ